MRFIRILLLKYRIDKHTKLAACNELLLGYGNSTHRLIVHKLETELSSLQNTWEG